MIRRAAAIACFLVSAIALAPSGSAFAADAASGPQDFSAADQYVESVPSTSGSKRPGDGSGEQPLPRSIQARLGNSASDSALNTIATSEQLGAPQRKLGKGRDSSPTVPGAAVDALGNGGGGTLVWLLVAVGVITALAAGKVGHRLYRDKKASGPS